MQTLPIQLNTARRDINFIIGHSLWEPLRQFLHRQYPHHSLFVICDETVGALYGEAAREQLASHPGWKALLSFPAGESSKSREHKDALEDQLLARRAGRDSVLVAIGGGVTGDLAGYVAATLHRGIPLIHLPTTLLAQVDSSIGGKVGINHPAGKNLLGAFYQPAAIYADINFLHSLPDDEYFNGLAEVIKYAVIMDDELWGWLERDSEGIIRRENALLERIVSRCAQLKIRVVQADEKEAEYRSILNFGHTVGHAIEQLSRYRLKHGYAIAAGMQIAVRLSRTHLGYPEERVRGLNRLLEVYQLNRTPLQDFSFEEVWECLQSDKKSRRQSPRFTLMNGENKPELFYSIEKAELEDAFSAT